MGIIESIVQKLKLERQQPDKVFRVLNHRQGPGRKTWYTDHKRVGRSTLGKPWTYPPETWPHSGKYILALSAKRAVVRFARWMAANPTAKSNREAPFHIIRNAALAQKQLNLAASAK